MECSRLAYYVHFAIVVMSSYAWTCRWVGESKCQILRTSGTVPFSNGSTDVANIGVIHSGVQCVHAYGHDCMHHSISAVTSTFSGTC